jgi:lipopolysaccharide transport system ATP-binding protein
MSNIVLQANKISKQYRLGQVGTGTISHDVNRWWHRVRGKEDPYLKIGEENDRTKKGNSEYVWALRDINFKLFKGDVLGIIGRNGAGKSTLLKILSRTTMPTTGTVKIKGRVASLLEVGTGFHPELSGRENIFLNGAILGMTKKEIERKFDEIVDFAGVERYIDTPVKRYSSGMYVRLAFGVAAHLEPEVLIVDEVLAVGDTEFQKKALGKMKDVSNKEGRTVLFVSHNMHAIRRLCNKAVLMENGRIEASGNTTDVLNIYNSKEDLIQVNYSFNDKAVVLGETGFDLLDIFIKSGEIEKNNISICDNFEICIKIKRNNSKARLGVTLILKDANDLIVFSSIASNNFSIDEDFFLLTCNIPGNLLNNILYITSFIFYNNNFENLFFLEDIVKINLDDSDLLRGDFQGNFEGIIRPKLYWDTKKV